MTMTIPDTAAEVLPTVHPGRSAANRRINMAKSVWTADRIEQLKGHIADGLSCGMIALQFGEGITRNAVIGKVSRMGLRPPEKRQPSVCKPARTSAGRRRRKRASAAPVGEWMPSWRFPEKPVNHGNPRPEPTEATEIVVDFIPTNPVKLLQLEAHHCRFPLGEPREMLFCGEVPIDGRPYCIRHCLICYQPSAPRKPWVEGRAEG